MGLASVGTGPGFLTAAAAVVAVCTHALGVVFAIGVGALRDLPLANVIVWAGNPWHTDYLVVSITRFLLSLEFLPSSGILFFIGSVCHNIINCLFIVAL